jgi:hypothetical protein
MTQATILMYGTISSDGIFRDFVWKVIHVVGREGLTKVQLSATKTTFCLAKRHHETLFLSC